MFCLPRSGVFTSALPFTFYMGHMYFFDMFFNGNGVYPQTTVQLSVHGLWIDISIKFH